MNQTIDQRYARARLELTSRGQGHVIAWWDQLSPDQKLQLIDDIEQIPWNTVDTLLATHVLKKPAPAIPADIAPAEVLPSQPSDSWTKVYNDAARIGTQALAEGAVAVLTVAGGQGTRLGIDGPKGMVAVTPAGNVTLFQLFAQMVLTAREKYQTAIPWYIMTSLANHQQTQDYLASNQFFGLPEADVILFSQGMLPAFSFSGKLLLDEKHRLALAPDGHGGVLRAMVNHGITADMKARGIKVVSYFQVDNPLVKPFDPLFIGLHLSNHSEMSCKVCPKADDFEKVGNVCKSGDRVTIIEYSDLAPELATRRNPDGSRALNAGNLAIHLLNVDFIDRIVGDRFGLPFRRAEKKVPFVDAEGQRRTPDQPNAIKLETFVFDALPLANHVTVLEVERAEEFSPVKNATGVDSLETSQRDQVLRAYAWLEQAGMKLPRKPDGDPAATVIILPTFALDAQDITAQRVATLKAIQPGDTLILS